MTTRRKLAVATASLLLLVAAGLAAATLLETPVVRTAVGMRIDDMKEASSYPFDFSGRTDVATFSVEEKVVFEYGGADVPDSLSFRLPPTRYVQIDQEAGWILGLTTFPQMHYTNLAETHKQIQKVVGIIDTTAWETVVEEPRIENEPITLEGLRNYARRSGPTPIDDPYLRKWKAGSKEIWLKLRRTRTAADEEYSEDHFLLTLWIDNHRFATKVASRVHARRVAAGDPGEPLPLQVWLDDPDWQRDSTQQRGSAQRQQR